MKKKLNLKGLKVASFKTSASTTSLKGGFNSFICDTEYVSCNSCETFCAGSSYTVCAQSDCACL